MLCAKIHKAFGFDPGPNLTLDAIIQLCRDNEFDPVVDYLNKLEWDERAAARSMARSHISEPKIPN